MFLHYWIVTQHIYWDCQNRSIKIWSSARVNWERHPNLCKLLFIVMYANYCTTWAEPQQPTTESIHSCQGSTSTKTCHIMCLEKKHGPNSDQRSSRDSFTLRKAVLPPMLLHRHVGKWPCLWQHGLNPCLPGPLWPGRLAVLLHTLQGGSLGVHNAQNGPTSWQWYSNACKRPCCDICIACISASAL